MARLGFGNGGSSIVVDYFAHCKPACEVEFGEIGKTMGGDIDAQVVGAGGDVLLTSMSGVVELCVPSGFGMELDLQIAFTRNSRKKYEIVAPGGEAEPVSSQWDYDHGTPGKFQRWSGAVNGGGNTIKIETVNGDIVVKEGC